VAPTKQVSPVIRISRGERDASARATHLEAATRKFLVTTNERKYMSTKTNFKRIALVAVAALGLGVLSSVPSQALISGLTVTTANGTATTNNYDSSTAATITVSGLLDASTDCVTVTYVAKSAPTGVTVGANTGILRYLDSTTATTATSTIVDTGVALSSALPVAAVNADGLRAAKLDSVTTANTFKGFRITGSSTAIIGASFRMELDSAVAATAGTYVFQVNVTQHTVNGAAVTRTTTAYDLSIVASATGSASTTANAANSFSRMGPSAVAAGASDANDSVLAVSAVSGTTRGTLFVAVRNASNASGVALDSLTAVVTGVGLVCNGGVCGKNIKVAATGDTSFTLQGDGNGGSSSIVITSSVTGLTYTHNLTYFATASKLTAAVYNPTLAMGSNPTAVAVVGEDTAKANWAGDAYIYASAAADALIGGSATTPVLCSYSAADRTHFCPITVIAAGTAKFKVINASTVAAATVTSNEVTITASNATAASVKLAFNKASYVAGEKAYITVTVLDAAGKTLQGQNFANLFATGGITSSYGFSSGSDTLTAVSVTTDGANSATTPTTAGAKTYTVYMPATGSVTITATGGSSLPTTGQVAVTASATVSDTGSQALAAVNALATTVASLRTLITTLTNLVLKIQKKVKA
jgi:hypothetical protein